MNYQVSPVGNEISCVMYGIDSGILNNHKKLENILLDGLRQDNFTILNKVSHEFKPHGFTALILLSESHATIHTYPEYSSLAFHLYSCRGTGDGRKTLEFIKEKLNPTSMDIKEQRVIVRK